MKRQEFIDKILENTEFTDTCWLWTGFLDRDGYGQLWANGKNRRLHRLAYEFWNGPIPKGYEIDHFLRNIDRNLCKPNCFNPEHIEAVPPGENTKRWMQRKYHKNGIRICNNGHKLVGHNLYVRVRDGYTRKECVACRQERTREWKAAHGK